MSPRGRMGTVLVCLAAFTLGGVVALYSAGVALFGDGDFAQRPPVLAGSVVTFALLGLCFGLVAPGAWKPTAICLGISVVPVVVLFGLDSIGQTPMMILGAGFILGDAAAGAFGTWTGARLRARRSL